MNCDIIHGDFSGYSVMFAGISEENVEEIRHAVNELYSYRVIHQGLAALCNQ